MGDNPESVCSNEALSIDYAEYLAALCNKRWRFIDAMYGVLPIIGMVTKSASARQVAPQEQMKMLAMRVLSTQVNDETNLTRLIALAQQQKLTALNIVLPYPLTSQQLVTIREACAASTTVSQRNECLNVQITPV
ncbi:hypothetical protein [Symbiopectobacterium sp.]|uniref:hypothetical protein n=1 Tax=Symbiopectobacterium sp. TaxID=2952789 RepID=UPI003F326819